MVRVLPPQIMDSVLEMITRIAQKTGKEWKSDTNPLLVSVRSGAAISMPGMMDTILNLGLNDYTVQGLASQSGNMRFALDSYRRFVQLFGKVVFGVDDTLFDEILDGQKRRQGVTLDGDLNEASLHIIIEQYKEVCKKHTGQDFPDDPDTQLELAIKSVF